MDGKKLVLTFNSVKETPPRNGMYYVLFQILGNKITYAFGYAQYDSGEWLGPNDTCIVNMWCIEPNPQLLF